MMQTKKNRIEGLYAVTPDGADSAWLAARATAALAGGARTMQYRNKGSDRSLRREQAETLLRLCEAHQARLIINDDVGLTLEVGAHGVHLGRDDAALLAARAQLGPHKLIGVSCYDDLSRALQAQEAGADYVAFGSFYPSTVKPEAVRAPLELLSQARARITLPIVAIGGITTVNALALIDAGADALAVVSALFQVPDTYLAAQAFARLLDSRVLAR